MMNPFEFVRHVHTDREKRMCHWGFDPIQWRHYLHLDGKEYAKSRDASLDESLELIQEGLDRLKHVKERFGRRGLKRKQVGRLFFPDIFCDLADLSLQKAFFGVKEVRKS